MNRPAPVRLAGAKFFSKFKNFTYKKKGGNSFSPASADYEIVIAGQIAGRWARFQRAHRSHVEAMHLWKWQCFLSTCD